MGNNHKVQIYPSIDRLHASWKYTISNPPKGYEYIGLKESESRKRIFLEKLRSFGFFRFFYRIFLNIFKSTYFVDLKDNVKILSETDLIFSMGALYNGEKPWIVDIIDSPYCLAGNNYNLFIENLPKIIKILSKDNCKKIICANESSIGIMKKFFPKKILGKTILVRPAVKKQTLKKSKNKIDNKVKFLFLGSILNPNDFYVKGGLETISAFEKIQNRCDCKLILRCKVPSELRKRVVNNEKIELIEDRVSEDELFKLYSSSDVLISPAHIYILMSWLESMSFGIPLIVLDTYAVKDYVKDNYNGLIVKKSDKISSYKEKTYPTNIRTSKFLQEVKKIDSKVIDNLSEKMILLAKNPSLRKKLGNNGREFIKKYFSIEERNKKFKQIFDQSIK